MNPTSTGSDFYADVMHNFIIKKAVHVNLFLYCRPKALRLHIELHSMFICAPKLFCIV